MVPLSEAYKIGDRMSRPWMLATIFLTIVAGCLMYIIHSAEVEAIADISAESVTADKISSQVNVRD